MSGRPDLAAIELLVAVADHGSLSSAARAVGMAQPNASRSVARLERNLQLVLLHRSTTGSTLTPEGLAVVDWARGVLEAVDRLQRGVAILREDGRVMTVAASQTVAEHLFPLWLPTFGRLRPGVRIAARMLNSAGVLDAVRAGECEIGFVEGPGEPHGVNHRVIATDELVLVVAPSHPWSRRRTPVTAEELRSTRLATREAGSGTRVALDEALGRPAVSAIELPTNAAVAVSVAAGSAPAVLSRLAVADALAAGSLVRVPVRGLELRRDLRAVWTGPRTLSGELADLVAVAATRSMTVRPG